MTLILLLLLGESHETGKGHSLKSKVRNKKLLMFTFQECFNT